jgi:hypothetical protein
MATSRQGVKVKAEVESNNGEEYPLLISQNWAKHVKLI